VNAREFFQHRYLIGLRVQVCFVGDEQRRQINTKRIFDFVIPECGGGVD
jgi:hypothetical protein